MATRYFALILGIFYLAAGILGFIPGITTPPPADRDLTIDTSYGLLFGLFPVNLLHNAVHLAIGLWGIMAYNRFSAARSFARAIAVIFLLLTVLGLIPGLDTLFGLVPLFSHDIWLHAVTGLAGVVFGWLVRPEYADTGVSNV